MNENTQKQCAKIVKMGTPKSAWNYVMDILPVLEHVQNTSFNFDDAQYTKSNERLYVSDTYQKSLLEIARQIEKGLTWKDVGDSTALERFQKIKGNINKSKSIGSYDFKLIGRAEPQMNFILLAHKDGTSEVLFNWDFRNIPHDPVVHLAKDRDIYGMYSAHFIDLWRVAVKNYDNI